jgi:hypothetical protein
VVGWPRMKSSPASLEASLQPAVARHGRGGPAKRAGAAGRRASLRPPTPETLAPGSGRRAAKSDGRAPGAATGRSRSGSHSSLKSAGPDQPRRPMASPCAPARLAGSTQHVLVHLDVEPPSRVLQAVGQRRLGVRLQRRPVHGQQPAVQGGDVLQLLRREPVLREHELHLVGPVEGQRRARLRADPHFQSRAQGSGKVPFVSTATPKPRSRHATTSAASNWSRGSPPVNTTNGRPSRHPQSPRRCSAKASAAAHSSHRSGVPSGSARRTHRWPPTCRAFEARAFAALRASRSASKSPGQKRCRACSNASRNASTSTHGFPAMCSGQS